MPFERPTLTELVDRVKSDIQTRVTSGETLLRRGVLNVLARVIAGAEHLLYSYIGYNAKQLFARTADTEGLEGIADEYGISRRAAIKATGEVTATGTNGVSIPADSKLQTVDGTQYSVDSTVIISGGTATLDVTAVNGGIDGNQDAGTLLNFTSPIAGVDSQVTVNSDGITGGEDEQTDEELRTAVLRRKQFPPYGGCLYDYETWVLEYTGVTRVWIFDTYNGEGTIGIAFVMDNSTPYIPSESTRNLVKSYITEHSDPATGKTVGAPITAVPGIYMIPLTEMKVNFDISVYPNSSSIQSDIEDELVDLILREGGPGETIYLSDIQSALSNVEDLEYFELNSPSVDCVALTTQIHALGTIIFSDY